jgi:hypothetical protein
MIGMIMGKPPMNREDWGRIFEIDDPWQRYWFTDEEASQTCAMSARSLRTLQSLNFLRSAKAKRMKGAQIRMWPIEDVLRASLVCELINFSGLSTPTAVRLLQLIPEWIIIEHILEIIDLTQQAFEDPKGTVLSYGWIVKNNDRLPTSGGDISLSVVDGKHVFVEGRFPELREDAEPGTDILPVGVVSDIYGRHPTIDRLPDTLTPSELRFFLNSRAHPVSVHRVNLELALRWRICRALGIDIHHNQDKGELDEEISK